MQIICVFIACIVYSIIFVLINGLSDLGISPAYSHCMGDDNFSPNTKFLILLVILPMITLVFATFWLEYKTAKLIYEFKKSAKYQQLMNERNFSLLIIIGEETSLRSTVVNFGVLVMYVISFLMFSLPMESQLERLLLPPAITWLLKEPLILLWASKVSKANLKSIQEESLKRQKSKHGRNVTRTNGYLDLLANNPFLEPVPFADPNDVLILQKSRITRPQQQSVRMETQRIEAKARFDLSVKRFEDSRKHALKNSAREVEDT